MRYVFFGTPRFAALILEQLIQAGIPPVALVCNPDKPFGRKKIITPPPTKVVASASPDIKIFQPEKAREIIPELKELNADIFIVAAYAKIIPPDVYSIPTHGTVGVHPSLLPKYRGPSPLQYALLNGEEVTGVTLYALDNEIDHGPIYLNASYHIHSNETMGTLTKNLADVASELLIANLLLLAEGKIKAVPQDEAQATFTKKISTEDAFITPEDLQKAKQGNAELTNTILRKIKAMNPEPGIWTMEGDQRVKLREAIIENGKLRVMKMQRAGE